MARISGSRILFFYPFLMALYPPLQLYAHNMDQTPALPVLKAIGVILALTFLLTVGCRRLCRDRARASLIAWMIVIVLSVYGHLHSLLLGIAVRNLTYRADFERLNWPARLDHLLHVPLLIGAAVLIGWLLIVPQRRRWQVPLNLTKGLALGSAVLVAMPLAQIAFYGLFAPRLDSTRAMPIVRTAHSTDEGALEYQPDVYYLILDAYARHDVLLRYFGFDNHEFLDSLRDRGFFVADNSFSNYSYTFLSLPSSLNFQYIDYLSDIVGETATDLRIPYRMIEDNAVIEQLKGRGYSYVHFNSTWGATHSNRNADVEIGYRKGVFDNEYFRILTQTTVLKALDSLVVEDLANAHLYAFEKLENVAGLSSPKFVFAHLLPPHYPFLFDRNGKVRLRASSSEQFQRGNWSLTKEYVDQLQYVNQRIIRIIDCILQGSENPPIIVVQADHGPQVRAPSRPEYMRARTAILNAYSLPGDGNDLLYRDITPVNTFRLILSHYFGADLPLLDDEVHFSDFSTPYDFVKTFVIRSRLPADQRRAPPASEPPPGS